MDELSKIGLWIDQASSNEDESWLRDLVRVCQFKMTDAKGTVRVLLRYYEANCHAGLASIHSTDDEAVWTWDQTDTVAAVLALRHAIRETSFDDIDHILQCRIWTNLGNYLSHLGRPIAAIGQWDATLRENPEFAMAIGNRAISIVRYGEHIFDPGHASIILNAARCGFDAALSETAEWDEIECSYSRPLFQDERDKVDVWLKKIEFNSVYDLNQWPLGNNDEERRYRRWCLDKRLFLNPLNDVLTLSVAARDVLHLPDHTYKVGEAPRFVRYYNLMKQEYFSARYHLYGAVSKRVDRFVDRETYLVNLEDGSVYGHYIEELKLAFRSAYALFDKIALFINEYYAVDLNPREVTFRGIWAEQLKGGENHRLRHIFYGKQNWPLRGIYYLSKDLFDNEFIDTAEPDAAQLADLRNQIEHRFLNLHNVGSNMSGKDSYGYILLDEFEGKTFRVLRMAREALIYLSLAVHREEQLRHDENDDRIVLPMVFGSIDPDGKI